MEKTTKKSSVKKAASSKKTVKEVVGKTSVKKSVHVEKVEGHAKKVVRKPARAKEVAHHIVEEVKPQVASKKVEFKPREILEKAEVDVAIAKPELTKVRAAKPRALHRAQTLAMGVGRRKEAVARVWLKLGSGRLLINDQIYDKYFGTQMARISATMPFKVINKAQIYDVFANVIGGGLLAQADAVKLGFARALLELNEEWRPQLRNAGLLTVDSRQKERKKYGQRGARRKFQFVKR